MITLYHAPRSRSSSIVWLLEEMGLPYRLRPVDLGAGADKDPEFMAINPGNITGKIDGVATSEPTFGLPAVWVTKDNRERAQMMNYTVVDPPSVLATITVAPGSAEKTS